MRRRWSTIRVRGAEMNPKPLTTDNAFFIDDEENTIYYVEGGATRNNTDFKDCDIGVRIDEVRAAVEYLKWQMLQRYLGFEKQADSDIKEAHMREIDSIFEIIIESFPALVEEDADNGSYANFQGDE